MKRQNYVLKDSFSDNFMFVCMHFRDHNIIALGGVEAELYVEKDTYFPPLGKKSSHKESVDLVFNPAVGWFSTNENGGYHFTILDRQRLLKSGDLLYGS